MNKAQLLADLSGRSYINWVGTPVLEDPNVGDETLDGKLYRVPTGQVVGLAGGITKVDFYVFNEGLGGELAIYAERPPEQRARPSALRDWFIEQKDNNPESMKAASIVWLSERWEQVVYMILDGSPLIPKYFYIHKGTAPVEISGTAAEIQLMLAFLAANRFSV